MREALRQLPEVEASIQKEEDRKKARVSTTEKEKRVMKMPDGGNQTAFNVQLSTDTESQIIVGIEVVNEGSDQGQLSPWLTQIHKRVGKYPDEALNDGGFVNKKEIENCAASASSYTQKSLNPRTKPARNESLCPKTASQSRKSGNAWALLHPKKFTKNVPLK